MDNLSIGAGNVSPADPHSGARAAAARSVLLKLAHILDNPPSDNIGEQSYIGGDISFDEQSDGQPSIGQLSVGKASLLSYDDRFQQPDPYSDEMLAPGLEDIVNRITDLKQLAYGQPPTGEPSTGQPSIRAVLSESFRQPHDFDLEEPLLQSRFFSSGDLIEHRRMMTLTNLDEHTKDLYDGLQLSEDINHLKNFIAENFNKILWTEYLEKKFEHFIHECATRQLRERLESDWTMSTMIRIIGVLLDDYLRLNDLLDEVYPHPNTREEIEELQRRCRLRIDEVLDDLKTTIRDQEIEIGRLNGEVSRTEADLKASKNFILRLKERQTVPDPYPQEPFMEELEYRMYAYENLNSTLQDELKKEREAKEVVLNKYLESEAKRLNDQNQQLLEIAETVKNLEMQDIFRDAVIEKIRSLTPNLSEVKRAVNDWLTTIHEAVQSKDNDLQNLTKQLQSLTYRYSVMELDKADLEAAISDMLPTINALKYEFINKRQEFLALSEQIKVHDEELRIRQEQARSLEEQVAAGKAKPASSQGFRQSLRASKFWRRKQPETPVSAKKKKSVTPKWMKKAFSPARAQKTPPLPSSSRDVPAVDIIPATPIEPRHRIGDTVSPTSFTQTVVLTSAKREDPVLVNIGVDPKPLTDTAEGEVFTCDVSVDIQPGPHGAIPKLSPGSPHHLRVPSTGTGRLTEFKRPRWEI